MIYREAVARGESLATRVKRADQRARLYGLEDDGASDLARRRRALKTSIATRRRIIDELRSGKQAALRGQVRDPETVSAAIAGHEARIVKLRAELDDLPAGILAPMTRRVAREDRRRRRAHSQAKKGAP